MKEKGLIQIYTGTGKGKTTAAVGLAVRAFSQGLKVCFVSFHKDPGSYANTEHKVLRKLGITVRCFAKAHPLCKKNSSKDLAGECGKGLEFIKKAFKKAQYDILIADEINICVRDGYLKEQDVLLLMEMKPESMEFVLTGRSAAKSFIKKADLVSSVKEIKHPFKKGVKARKGIDY